MSKATLKQIMKPLNRPDTTWSTGAFIREKNRYLFCATEIFDEIRLLVPGGRLEEDEQLIQALVREGHEEASIQILPKDSVWTTFILNGNIIERVCLPEHLAPRPTLVWTGPLNIPECDFNYSCCVWNADYEGDPQPGAEISYILWADPQQITESKWSQLSTTAGNSLAGKNIRKVGTASLFEKWSNIENVSSDPKLQRAYEFGMQVLLDYGADAKLIDHCQAVTQVALSIGRHLNRSGGQIDLPSLTIASLCHDVGRTHDGQRSAGTKDHGKASAIILKKLSYRRPARWVKNHMLPCITEGTISDELAGRVMFYADKVVAGSTYTGIDGRIDDMIKRNEDLKDEIEVTRKPLKDLEKRLSANANLPQSDLHLLCYFSAVSQKPDLSNI